MEISVTQLTNSKPLSTVNLHIYRGMIFLHINVEVILTPGLRHRDHLKAKPGLLNEDSLNEAWTKSMTSQTLSEQ